MANATTLLTAAEPSAVGKRRTGARRGHGDKIAEAVQALMAANGLPVNLRPGERDKRINAWLISAGYSGSELPSRSSIARHFPAASAKRAN